MFDALRQFTDRVLGRGSAAITVPVMDGTLRPNRVLDQASVVAQLVGIDDLASDGRTLWASAGPVLWTRLGGNLTEARRFDAEITAIAVSAGGRLAVALAGERVVLFDVDGRPSSELKTLQGRALRGVNALAWDGEAALLLTEGSMQHAPAAWCRDLMTLGRGGRVARWVPGSDAQVLLQQLGYAFGVLPAHGGVLVAESWRHRVLEVGIGGMKPLLAELPGYPSRLARAAGGGFWLTCFVCRSQLVEFVLREPAYRRRMVAEIDPRHWIAPALSSGHDFLEPLQGAGVKQMGVLKPWAPPRSYGLVLRVADDGRILRSLHSQVDGRHHGITAVVEHDGALYVASKGSGRLLQVPLDAGAPA
jgi:hypothetical protein